MKRVARVGLFSDVLLKSKGLVTSYRFAWILGLGLALSASVATAQEIQVGADAQKRIASANSVDGESLSSGAQVSDATGLTEFAATDLDIPGNDQLPVRLSRRLRIQERYLDEELGGFGNWDADVPYIEGTFDKTLGWVVDVAGGTAAQQARCSNAAAPRISVSKFVVSEVWHGYNVHIPDVIDGQLVVNTNRYVNPTDGQTYPWTLSPTTRVGCLPSLASGQAGQGFVVRLDNGTRYFFNWMVERTAPTLRKGPRQVIGYSIPRKRIFILATRIEDRFGNWVNYAYTADGQITGITASDGREIGVSRGGSQITAQTNGRNVSYALTGGQLSQVTQPDGSQWSYSAFGLNSRVGQVVDPDLEPLENFDPHYMCLQPPAPPTNFSAANFQVQAPSGLTENFQFQRQIFMRNGVSFDCIVDFHEHQVNVLGGHISTPYMNGTDWKAVYQAVASLPIGATPSDYAAAFQNAVEQHTHTGPIFEPEDPNPSAQIQGYARILDSNTSGILSLMRHEQSGPGLPQTRVTTRAYDNPYYEYCGYYSPTTGTPLGPTCAEVMACIGCAPTELSRSVTITRPGGEQRVMRVGTMRGRNDGQLLDEQTQAANGTTLREIKYTYANPAITHPFSVELGQSLSVDPMHSRVLPLTTRQILQEGASFTMNITAFDALARPLNVDRWSAGTASDRGRTDVTAYHDNPSLWVMGQTALVTNANTGHVPTQISYNAEALPSQVHTFGKLQQTLTYNANGTLATVTDGKSNQTSLSNWKRGIPQLIQFPATAESPSGATKSFVVNDHGWITSVTDENGFTTSYQHDPMGRTGRIDYPAGDSTAWLPTTIEFRPMTAGEWRPPGVAAGQWPQYRNTGNRIDLVYMDALWRPVLTHTYDHSNVAATLQSISHGYDVQGRENFVSYPSAELVPATTGVRKVYDALDRITRIEQDSELGVLGTNTEYLSGFQTRVTDPRGAQTHTSYMAWDEPNYDRPLGINHPESRFTEIYWDALGDVTALRRRNASGSESVGRYFVYDAHRRLCKRTDPESGATVMEYDAANNVTWSATGLGLPSTTDCNRSEAYGSGRRVEMTYDARNRETNRVYADSRGNTTTTYYPDGKPNTLTTYNDGGNGAPVVTTLTYNKRRLLIWETSSQPGWYAWTTTLGHDGIGNVTGRSYPNGLGVYFHPNALGQPTQVTTSEGNTLASNVRYYPNGSISGFTYGNGVVHSMTQNARQLPQRVTSSGGVLDYEYAYDNNANPLHIYDLKNGPNYSLQSRWMEYDLANPLTAVGAGMFQGDNWHRMTYDAIDNLKSWKLGGVKDYANYVYDGRNLPTQILNSGGAAVVTQSFDVQGNLNNKNGQAYAFDYGNRLREVSGKEWSRYDAFGHRVLRWQATEPGIIALYTHDGQLLFDNNNRPSILSDHAFVYLQGSLLATREGHMGTGAVTWKYQHTDALGSPVATTNQAGTVIERNDWEPWGKSIGKPTMDTVGYTGHQMDGVTGNIYMQQRYMDPDTGQMMSVDPVYVDLNTGANFNRRNYANNNPYKYIDPDGRRIIARNVADQARIEKYINALALGVFKFQKNGELAMISSEGNSKMFSAYYRDKLVQGIKNEKTIVLDIAKKYRDRETGKLRDIDKHSGGGVTGGGGNENIVNVSISGNSNNRLLDTSGKPLYAPPEYILAHEIVGHAVPRVAGGDAGNAVENENKVRSESGRPQQRASEPSHKER